MTPATARPDGRPAPSLFERLRPFSGLIVVALLMLCSAPFARSPLQDAVTLGATDATLRRSAAYVLLAPLSNVLDLLTLLSVRQHVALLLTLLLGIAAWTAWRTWATRAAAASLSPGRRAVRIAVRIGIPLVGIVAVYAAGVLLPRPMAALEMLAPDLVVVDFHSHTSASHDGRSGWTAEDNRAWHRDAGFDVAYVTDHRSFDGARDGWANNPRIGAEGTILLPGIEVVLRGEHVNILDADRAVRGLLDPTQRDVDEDALRLASLLRGTEPLLVETIPGDLARMIPAQGPGTPGVRAIELVDGAPRGLGQSRRQRARIVHLADSLNLALVAGSDHHGWGYAASAWTLLYAPGWRGASPSELAPAIPRIIRGGGKATTKVIERYVADTETGIRLPLTVPLVGWGMLRTLSVEERVVWIAWALALYFVARIGFLRRRPPELR